MFGPKSPKSPFLAPGGLSVWAWRMKDPLDAQALLSAPSRWLGADGVVDRNGNPRYRLIDFIADHPLPALGTNDRRPHFPTCYEVVIGRTPYHEDRLYNGGARLYACKRMLETQVAGWLHSQRAAEGPPPRFVIQPGDDDAGTIVRTGSNFYVPDADEPAEGRMTLLWTGNDGGREELIVPPWRCLRAVGNRVEEILRPAGPYAPQRRLAFGWDTDAAPIRLSGGPGRAGERFVIDLHAVRAGWADDPVYQTEIPMTGGTVTVRLEQTALRPATPAPDHAAAVGRSAADPDPSPRAPFPPLPGFLRQGRENGEDRRKEPFLKAAPRDEAVTLVITDAATASGPAAGDGDGKPTLVLPVHATALPVAPQERPTLVLPEIDPGAGPRWSMRRAPGLTLAVKALALARIDGASRRPDLSRWELTLGPQSRPMARMEAGAAEAGTADGGGEPPVQICADTGWPHLMWRRAGETKWRTSISENGTAPVSLAGGVVLTPVAAPLRAHYHALLQLPEPLRLPLAEGCRHRFGRVGGVPGDDRPKLSFGLLAVPGSLELRGAADATLEDVNLSREHGVLHAGQGQLHIALTAGQTPVWKLAADGSVAAMLEPGSRDELVLTVGEAFLVGGYLVTVQEG